jgi:TPR repeat protein
LLIFTCQIVSAHPDKADRENDMGHHCAFLRLLLFGLLLALAGCVAAQNNDDLLRLRQLKDQAYAGDSESQYQLGLFYASRDKWPWDNSRAYSWFLPAAESDHVDAQYMVGMSQLLGQGTKKNLQSARDWLENAALQGHLRSQYQLGEIYLHGNGVRVDASRGRYWLEQAAWGGYAKAQILLAALFHQGLGGQKNKPEAWAWLTRAARGGDESAMKALRENPPRLSQQEKLQARKLLERPEPPGEDKLYKIAKVRYLQAMLNQLGYAAGEEDGLYGEQTKKAVADYLQKTPAKQAATLDQLIRYLQGQQTNND